MNREAALRVDFDDPRESFLLKGKFVRTEAVEGRKELIALAIQFTDNTIPMGYKIRLNDYIGMSKPPDQSAAENAAAKANQGAGPENAGKAAELPESAAKAGETPAAEAAPPETAGPEAAPAGAAPAGASPADAPRETTARETAPADGQTPESGTP
jgi:hypothetical protein